MRMGGSNDKVEFGRSIINFVILETKLEVEFNLKGDIKNKSDELASSSNNS